MIRNRQESETYSCCHGAVPPFMISSTGTNCLLARTRLPFTRPSSWSPLASTALAFPLDEEEVDGSAGRRSSTLATLECRRFRL